LRESERARLEAVPFLIVEGRRDDACEGGSKMGLKSTLG
jgi:hypothetical protein